MEYMEDDYELYETETDVDYVDDGCETDSINECVELEPFEDVKKRPEYNVDTIPEELKQLTRWVSWGCKWGEANKKVPYDSKTRNRADITNPECCSSFDVAQSARWNFAGIGFVLYDSDPYVVVDIDDCINDEGRVSEHALDIIASLNSYTEISPSGRGIHIFARAKKNSSKSRSSQIEIYDSKRYITVTGNLLSSEYSTINDRQESIDALCDKYFGENKAKTIKSDVTAVKTAKSTDDMINKALSSDRGEVIRTLLDGDWQTLDYGSQSEADLALCEHLAFWLGKDRALIDKVFRESGLYRPKWDELRGTKTYGNITIDKAIESTSATYTAGHEVDWPEPQMSSMPPAVPFPVDALPEAIRPFVVDSATRLSVPPEYMAIPSMVVMASMIGNNVEIMPKQHDSTWTERPCLWGFIVGNAGTKKTPALKQACSPYELLQEDLRRQYSAQHAKWLKDDMRYTAAKRVYEKKLNQFWEGTLSKEPEMPSILETELEAPVSSRLTLQDVTVERICQVMNHSPHLTLYRDELSGFLESLNKYNKAKDDRKFYLECYTGGYHTVERIGRESVYIKDLYLNMVGGIQPGVLNGFFKTSNDGFIERFGLIAIPDHNSVAGYVDVEPDYEAINAYNELCQKLFHTDWSSLGLIAGPNKLCVKYDEAAQQIYNEWTMSNIRKQSGTSRILQSLKKAPGLVARLSLVLHLVKVVSGQHTGDASRVSASTIEDVIAIVDGYLEYMWCRLMYIVDGGDSSSGIGKKLLEYISGHPNDIFSFRDIKQKGWSGICTDEDVTRVLRTFVDMNWISGPDRYTSSEGGRPSMVYRINPKVRKLQ